MRRGETFAIEPNSRSIFLPDRTLLGCVAVLLRPGARRADAPCALHVPDLERPAIT